MRIISSMNFLCVLIVLCTLWVTSNGQENTQTRIPSSLAECYTNPEILNRDGRLPMNINMLIELIRKVEDSQGFTQDIRTLSTSLVHRFRLDGIERAPGVFTSNTVLPFSPSSFQFSKHRLLLSRLVPGNAITFPNVTLTSLERVNKKSQITINSRLTLLFHIHFGVTYSALFTSCYQVRLICKSVVMNQHDVANCQG